MVNAAECYESSDLVHSQVEGGWGGRLESKFGSGWGGGAPQQRFKAIRRVSLQALQAEQLLPLGHRAGPQQKQQLPFLRLLRKVDFLRPLLYHLARLGWPAGRS